ncbi:putative tyrosine-protein kinase Wsck [Centruroides sculpturatus]|uniref:putative tyrosine-protein kinase Wsck n=1 Tax=Centruroides sculpturatus TaxID=218467 RepID=UPI000C6CDB71|nr:putative tyrosine-protein kinase Wsck [Centruroides sculpturatus]
MDRIFWLFILIIICHSSETSIPGPSSLKVINRSETEIHVQWSPVSSKNIINYHIKADPIKSYYENQPPVKKEWSFSNKTEKADLLQLEPGTQYNITIWASTSDGDTTSISKFVWTVVGAPERPPVVQVLKRTGKTIGVKLHPAFRNDNSIMFYKVIVLKEEPIVTFNSERLYNYSEAVKNGLSFYVAAQLTPEEIEKVFYVGDGKVYGGFYNAPLSEDQSYDIMQGNIISLNGVTKASYSPTKTSPNITPLGITHRTQITGPTSSTLTVILATAIGIFGFLLILSFIIYYLLRRHYGKRRPSDELVLHVQGSESEENGSVPGVLQIDEDTDLGDFFENLKERYWHIPKNHITIHQTVLGQGEFGEVREGIVFRKAHGTTTLVQQVYAPPSMDEKERKNMLSELDTMIRIRIHPHVVEFIGVYEDRDLLHIVIENSSSTLRGMLLRSRQLTDGYVCNLAEAHLIEIAFGIIQGMIHLSEHGILHHHLSSRSIVMIDGYTPKIANFGLGFFNPLGKKLDFTRWTPPESLRSANFNVKSDVWSFGVLLWEICTLGGTPYVILTNKEIPARIFRGMRLPQPKGVSDELYQLMLHCWEFDLDERPTFHELATVTQNMLLSAKDYLRLDSYPGFQYEKFDPSADEM